MEKLKGKETVARYDKIEVYPLYAINRIVADH